jgi:hypothetical protein
VARDLTIVVENRAGALAALGDATARVGMSIEGICGYAAFGKKTYHLLVADDKVLAVRAALEAAGIEVSLERQVYVLEAAGPGAIGNAAARLARDAVNVDLVYLASGNRLVLGVDSIDAAADSLRGLSG